MTKKSSKKFQCVVTDFGSIRVFTFPMKVRDAISIAYVAPRGISDEDGAVQRILNSRRVSDIKAFVLEGNTFFNTFILNWTDDKNTPTQDGNTIEISIKPFSAQVLDGQHRLKGLETAMREDDSIGDLTILVSMCIALSTSQAAQIFLNINTEQKPVPKSLIYDLFGEVVDDQDHAINRAKDIAKELNENLDSPYYKYIKFPGSPRGAGSVDLSVVIAALKESLKSDGIFKSLGLKDLEVQQKIIINYFIAIEKAYESRNLWHNKNKNPFLRSYGFTGALDYLTSTLLEECARRGSFKIETFTELLGIDDSSPLIHEEMKSLDGKTAKKRIVDYLKQHQTQKIKNTGDYEF